MTTSSAVEANMAVGGPSGETPKSLDELIARINDGLNQEEKAAPPPPTEFVPRQPQTLTEACLTAEEVERIVCKLMACQGCLSGRKIAEHIGIPFGIMEGLLRQLKSDLIIAY